MEIKKTISIDTTIRYEFTAKQIEQILIKYLEDVTGTDHSTAEIRASNDSSLYVILHQYSKIA